MSKQDILIALRGGMPERIPWTCYNVMLPRGEQGRILRGQGLKLAYMLPHRSPEIFEFGPNTEIIEKTLEDGSKLLKRITYRTPAGEISEVLKMDYGNGMAGKRYPWRLEFAVKKPADYEVLEYILRDQIFNKALYEEMTHIQDELGDDGIVIPRAGKTPFQTLWLEYTGMERICHDLSDEPGLIRTLTKAMMERDRQIWRFLADSPAEAVSCSDNISGDMISPHIFEEYFLPYYQAISEVIDLAKRPLVLHFDGLVRPLMTQINKMPRGCVIEALTPKPTGDITVAEARQAWKDRVLWLNFPSSVHLCPPDEVERITRELIQQAAPGNGFLIGVTENMPESCWRQSLAGISRAVRKYGDCPVSVKKTVEHACRQM